MYWQCIKEGENVKRAIRAEVLLFDKMVQLRTVFLIATMYTTIIESTGTSADVELIKAAADKTVYHTCREWVPMLEKCKPIFDLFESLIGTSYSCGISPTPQCKAGSKMTKKQHCIIVKTIIDCVVPFHSGCTHGLLEKISEFRNVDYLKNNRIPECQPDRFSIPEKTITDPNAVVENCPETEKMEKKCEKESAAVAGSTLATQFEGATLHTKEKIGIMCLDMKSLVDCMAEFKADCNEALFKNETETIASINDIYGSIPECSKKKLFLPGNKTATTKTGHTINIMTVFVFVIFYCV